MSLSVALLRLRGRMTRIRPRLLHLGLIGLALSAAAAPARADATLLVGLNTASAPHPTVGVAWGKWDLPIGFDVEYASSIGTSTEATHSVHTISVNLLANTPVRIHDAQLYGVAGLGLYGETGGGKGSGEVAAKILGAGVKVPLGGALKLRLDYRLFFGNAPDASAGWPRSVRSHRFSAGFSFAF